MREIDREEKLVKWAYTAQWAAALFPPLVVVSFIVLLFVRGKVSHTELRSHLNWQLATYGAIAALIPIGFGLLMIGFSGFNTDSIISVIATFSLMGLSAVALPWVFYRLIYGTIRFTNQVPMERMFP